MPWHSGWSWVPVSTCPTRMPSPPLFSGSSGLGIAIARRFHAWSAGPVAPPPEEEEDDEENGTSVGPPAPGPDPGPLGPPGPSWDGAVGAGTRKARHPFAGISGSTRT